jgi:hypothetical protein
MIHEVHNEKEPTRIWPDLEHPSGDAKCFWLFKCLVVLPLIMAPILSWPSTFWTKLILIPLSWFLAVFVETIMQLSVDSALAALGRRGSFSTVESIRFNRKVLAIVYSLIAVLFILVFLLSLYITHVDATLTRMFSHK